MIHFYQCSLCAIGIGQSILITSYGYQMLIKLLKFMNVQWIQHHSPLACGSTIVVLACVSMRIHLMFVGNSFQVDMQLIYIYIYVYFSNAGEGSNLKSREGEGGIEPGPLIPRPQP